MCNRALVALKLSLGNKRVQKIVFPARKLCGLSEPSRYCKKKSILFTNLQIPSKLFLFLFVDSQQAHKLLAFCFFSKLVVLFMFTLLSITAFSLFLSK